MARTILMGDPAYFSVLGGANPHTRNALGLRKKVDAARARTQWHALARALIRHGVEVCAVEAHPQLTGLVYPANAGFLYPLEASGGTAAKRFFLSNLIPTRQGEREIYGPYLRAIGYETLDVAARFEGEADFFPAADSMIFTHGRVEHQRFVPRLGLPPWKRRYGFRSDIAALDELRAIVAPRPVVSVELALEAHYHGDTVLCSFGPTREYLLAYMQGLSSASRDLIRGQFGNDLIELAQSDAELYAANSFQTDHNGKLYLFMPEGVSADLQREIRARAVEPVLVNVSEFLAKGGGSIKCMILDLGPSGEQPADAAAVAFRADHSYQRLFAESQVAGVPA